MSEEDGLVCAYVLDGRGGARALEWDGIRAWRPEDGVLWVHLDRVGAEADRWVRQESGIDPVMCDALLAGESRPRLLHLPAGLLVMLRGVNLNPGAEPEDMVGLRMWFESRRIVTLRHFRLMAIRDMRELLAAGVGPTGPGTFLTMVADRLIDRMGPVLADIDDEVDELEAGILTAQSADLRTRLGELRRSVIAIRRYLSPQRDVMARLQLVEVEWLTEPLRARLREIGERTLRYVEGLDEARERAAVTQDELNNRIAESMNRTMYLLTILSAVLLPPSLLTGLLGINVGGLPGSDFQPSFWIVVGLIVVVAAVEIWLLRRLKWI